MILYPDGRVGGTPEEITKYMEIKQEKPRKTHPIPDVPMQQLGATVRRSDERYPGGVHGPYATNVPSQAHYDVNAKTTAV
ncbi:hypothetical protein KIH86_23995 [Paenibacillus sp. HN-1]|uniref:hypothetical protein n=1 Tax=Paenibacillus TaxID=44249 RepID=UPI001CA8F439|nr:MULTISPECIES: hypothetical protein [Paenibacillus]MBY9081214.1 hypothetical protein [Paenibacillus sp. CGMCC 1.18879]MBY9087251.1 hypothetical protein [Paenibacillus sinensis]